MSFGCLCSGLAHLLFCCNTFTHRHTHPHKQQFPQYLLTTILRMHILYSLEKSARHQAFMESLAQTKYLEVKVSVPCVRSAKYRGWTVWPSGEAIRSSPKLKEVRLFFFNNEKPTYVRLISCGFLEEMIEITVWSEGMRNRGNKQQGVGTQCSWVKVRENIENNYKAFYNVDLD